MRFLIVALFVLSLISCNDSKDDSTPDFSKDSIRIDSISMGANYGNDIFYNLKQGEVKSEPRTNWDIAFKTNGRSSSILINSTAGISLWEVPGNDTTKWNNLDTAGMKNNWGSLVNSDTTWSLSAFEQNQTGHPDYGWGEYNSITHDVNGNSIFVIQLQDGNYKKVIIKKREASSNTYYFKYANLNGSSSTEKSVKCGDYSKKNFIYFSLSTGNAVDREPDMDKWDIVLTRYIAQIAMGPGPTVPYPVVGFLQNEGVLVAKMSGDTASNNYSSAAFKTKFSNIGSGWKSYNQSTGVYTIVPNLYYFVKTKDNSTVKLLFKKYEGDPKNKAVFERKILK